MIRVNHAAMLHGPRDLRWTANPLGELPAGTVRVNFGAGGICGSDLHYFAHGRTGDFVVTSPLILGHEVAGTIAGIGSGVEGLNVGDRVAVNPSRWCGRCAPCQTGRKNLCENIYFMGSASKTPHMQGGFAESFHARAEQCIVLADDVPLSSAALAEPLAVALHAVARAGDLRGARVAIFGAGPIGLLILLAARHAGAGEIVIADIAEGPLSAARRLKADATINAGSENGFSAIAPIDVAFEVSGSPAGLADAIRRVRRGGTVVQVGNLPGGELAAPINLVMSKELRLVGSFRFGDEFARAVGLISSGAIDVSAIVTATLPLSSAKDAFALAGNRAVSVKVLLTGQ